VLRLQVINRKFTLTASINVLKLYPLRRILLFMLKRILISIALIAGLVSPLNAQATEDISCLNFKVINEKGLWSLSEGPEVTTAVVTWSVVDTGNCVIGNPSGAWVSGDKVEVNWTSVNYIR